MYGLNTSNHQATNEYQRAMAEYQSYADWLRDMIADPSLNQAQRDGYINELNHLHERFDGLRPDDIGMSRRDCAEFADSVRDTHDGLIEFVATHFDPPAVEAGADPLSMRAEHFASSWHMTRVMVPLSEMSGSELSSLLNSNPGAFARKWRDMDPEDRQLVMFTMQQHASTESQLTTLMTNLAQSAHQAAMAVARNLSA